MQWDCKFCKENSLDIERNCEGKYEPIAYKLFDELLDKCPVSALQPSACETIGIIEACEGSGFGSSSMLPSVFLDETQYYHNVRRVVLQEKAKLEKTNKEGK